MKKTCVALLATAAAISATAAGAANYQAGNLMVPTMTYGTNAQAASSVVTGSAYSGVGTLFISYQHTATTGYGAICTGSLINATTVLTAAHCLYDHDEETGAYDPVTSIDFYLPSYGATIDAQGHSHPTFSASSWAYNPGFDNPNPTDPTVTPHTGDIGSGNDVALFTLSQAATGYQTYSLYTGNNPLGAYTEVGTGTIGGPSGTGSVAADYLKRTGNNEFELYGDDVFSDVGHGVVLSDFDDGTAAHDVFGNLADLDPADYSSSLHQTGVAGEADSSPGDSGGPEFNAAGQIVSVTSFGITGAVLQGYCGTNRNHPDAIDPYHATAAGGISSSYTTDLSLCTNSSVGEIAGDTLVSNNLDFINGYLASHSAPGAVPEPATWAMLMVGFGAVGSVARRRKANVRFSQAI